MTCESTKRKTEQLADELRGTDLVLSVTSQPGLGWVTIEIDQHALPSGVLGVVGRFDASMHAKQEGQLNERAPRMSTIWRIVLHP